MIPGSPHDTYILSMLALGHVLADFLLQTRWMVERKDHLLPLVAHGLVVVVSHGATLWPLVGRDAVAFAFVLGVVHVATDRAKMWFQAWFQRRDRNLCTFSFLVDQALHGVALGAAWWILRGWDVDASGSWLAPVALVAAAFVFNGIGAGALVGLLLRDLRGGDARQAEEGEPRPPAHGRAVGMLERWMVLLLALAGQWSAIGLVLAAKSLARFEELKHRPFAETYLVGTLASVLVAMVSGAVLVRLLW